MESGLSLEEALGSTFGVDLMPDNIELCKDRLLCGRDDLREIVDNNIVQGDAQTYHYRFDGTPAEQRFKYYWQYESEIHKIDAKRKKDKGDLTTKYKGQQAEVKNQKRLRKKDKEKFEARDREQLQYIANLEAEVLRLMGIEEKSD